MQRSVTIVVTAAIAAAALVACSGGKQSSSTTTTTTTTTQTSPGASPAATAAVSPGAASPAAASPAATTATKTMKSTTMKSTTVAAGGASAAGQKVFTTNCSSCHQANGKGQPGVFPPLAGNSVVTGPPGKVISIVKNGLSGKVTVGSTTYNGQMPAWKGTLSDSDIASVITYIRSAWGNKS